MEFLRTHNLNFAEVNIKLSKEICQNDPLIFNELGVIAYKSNDYQGAIKYFEQAIKLSPLEDDDISHLKAWESPFFNIGHCFRKLEMFDAAIKYYESSQRISPKDGSIDSAIGFTHHLRGDLDKAIEFYHKGLALKGEDLFIQEMLNRALQQCNFTY